MQMNNVCKNIIICFNRRSIAVPNLFCIFAKIFQHHYLSFGNNMYKKIYRISLTAISVLILSMAGLMSCGRSNHNDDNDSAQINEIVIPDTATPLPVDSIKKEEPEDTIKLLKYSGSVLPKIEEASKEYAAKLKEKGKNGFIVVDKARMKVILYDGNGLVKKAYGMACAKNYGTKHKKADSRTPEGFFYVQGVYDSTDWLFTDDDGHTSKKKGQFGPRFIRLSIPTTTQIGIHGTCAPWSIGHRVSHGCIRITNENIMELVDLVYPGMPVIVIPGKRDRKVNRDEGVDIVYFPTSPETAIRSSELREANMQVNANDSVISAPVVDSISQPDVVVPSEPDTTADTLKNIRIEPGDSI